MENLEAQEQKSRILYPKVLPLSEALLKKGYSIEPVGIEDSAEFFHRSRLNPKALKKRFTLEDKFVIARRGGFTFLDLDPNTTNRTVCIIALRKELPKGESSLAAHTKILTHPPSRLNKIKVVKQEDNGKYKKRSLVDILPAGKRPLVVELGWTYASPEHRGFALASYALRSFLDLIMQIHEINPEVYLYINAQGNIGSKLRPSFIKSLESGVSSDEVNRLLTELGLESAVDLFGLPRGQSRASEHMAEFLGLPKVDGVAAFSGFGPIYFGPISEAYKKAVEFREKKNT